MTSVKIADLKNHLSEHLRAVEAGATIEVTDRDRPIARIVPIATDPIVILRAKRAFSEVRDRKNEPARWAISSTELLLEDRGKR